MKSLNRIVSAILIFLGMVIIGCTEEPAPIAVASVTLDSTSMTLEEGESQKLTATVSPSNAENKTVLWTSSNSSVASVKDGLVSAIKSGKATITAKSDDGGKTATCEVTVKAKVYPVESVSLDKTSYEMTEGDEFTLTATVKPDNATNKNITWSSSNTSVATVSNGKVTALKAGTATITVKTEDGGKTATCKVNVKAKVYPVESVSLDKTSYEMTEGDTFTLTATVKPDNATNKNVIWSSSNNSVASVSNGKVTALKAGAATITVKTEDGSKTATCEVNVKAKVYPVESVSLDKTSYEMTEGDEFTLTATVKPDNATNKNITWSSSNTSVASVSNGKVTALKAGTATITVKTEDGGKTATCKVIVNEKVYPVESVSLDKTSYEMTEGDEFTLTATVKPDNATNKNVTWSSSNTSVAIVSNGTVTAKKAGTTTITVKTEDGGKTATCKVTVNAKIYPVTSVSLDRTSAELTEGDEIVLIATVNPSIASNKNVIWSSSNISVATVSNGTVKALSVGTATITVKTEDRGKTATCTIVVKSATKLVDYIDEYGINHGKGISIINNVYGGYEELPKETVWAPVNCGYHMPDLKYGKLYQRGRKYGQGYGETYGELEPELVKNPGIAAKEISEESNSNKFYYGLNCMLDTPWVDNVWNIGSDKAPIKTENDPCPDGWRVPTEEEIWGLTQNYSSWTINEFGQYGYWFSGINAYSSDVPQIFLPAAGHRGWEYGVAEDRDETGNYWSSSMRNYSQGYHSCFREDRVVIYCDSVAEGYSVRCVQE